MAAGLLLAAGEGRRYGMPKALAAHGGRLLLETALASLRDGGCKPVIVVLGAAAGQVRAGTDLGDAVVVDNPAYATGMGSSLRVGLAAADRAGVVAVTILLVDTPGITAAAVRRLDSAAAPDTLAVATYRGRPGHPVVIGRAHWAAAAASAVGDVGARAYLRANAGAVRAVPCDDIADGEDLDTPYGR